MWRLGGGCALPLGALATVAGSRIELLAVVISPDGSHMARAVAVSDTPEGAAASATKELIAEGAEAILEALERRGMTQEPLARQAHRGDEAGRSVGRAGPATATRRERDPIVAPAIEIVPARSAALTRALRELEAGRFAWIMLTSRVDRRDARLAALVPRERSGEGRGDRRRDGAGVPPLGPSEPRPHADDVHDRRARARVPARATAACSARAPTSRPTDSRTRSPRRAGARSGSTPTARAWRGRCRPRRARRCARGAVDAVTFTSASTVRGFVGAVGVVRGDPKVVCIGPVTAREARDRGMRVAPVANPHTIEGLVDALERASSDGRVTASLREPAVRRGREAPHDGTPPPRRPVQAHPPEVIHGAHERRPARYRRASIRA